MQKRHVVGWLAFGVVVVALAAGQASLRADDRQTVLAPRFEVDPVWPKPLPNHWILGSVIGESDRIDIMYDHDHEYRDKKQTFLHDLTHQVRQWLF